jgi:uncharacterized protein (DUF427 family)
MPSEVRVPPGEGQESGWDYPRPPRVEATTKRVRVEFNGVVIADTRRAERVLETSHPPVYYIPPDDIKLEHLSRSGRTTYCEWKGRAGYYTLTVADRIAENAAWFYPDPTPGFEVIRDYVAFYPGKMDAAYVDDERVTAQSGGFYGGWITADVVGSFKGDPPTQHE